MEANEARSRAMKSLSLELDKYPRDLLQRFTCSSAQQSEHATPREDSEDIELNLGLSLGGRFGVDKSAKKLIRSSSIAGTIPVVRDDDFLNPQPISYPTLMRTSSLPTETEEEWRKRKELQTLRRMEAKRRRSQKQRSSKAEKDEEKKENEGPAGLTLKDRQLSAAANRFSSMVAPPFGMPTGAAAARQAVLGGVVEPVAKGSFLGLQGYGRSSSLGSAESQGGSSLGISELETKFLQEQTSLTAIQNHQPRVTDQNQNAVIRPSADQIYGFVPVLLFLLIVGQCVGRPMYPLPSTVSEGEKQPLQTSRPYNVAHRGANGEYPEETTVAYLRAIEEGADFIETDILASKDGVLICHHDVNLDDTTDIANHTEFADRKRTYEIQGVNITGYFVVDFTLEELQTLGATQRFPFRDHQYDGKYTIITFEDYISIALNAKRVVGIYPEIKNPTFINQHIKWADGKKFEDKFVATLKKYGYSGKYLSKEWLKQPVFIQSFAPASLVFISNLTDMPKVFLIDDVDILTEDTNQTYWEITSDSYLDYIKNYVVGIGPWKDTIVFPKNNNLDIVTDLVSKAHARGLQVHPYTFRNENAYLHFDFHQDPYAEYDYWINTIGVDGVFTDFPGSFHNYQELTSPLSTKTKSN
ncbi:Ninja-family protein AFP2 [Morella rubra]|uniref:glycerophosphodiester phosphodiesterase n=1 Tax=Morella rubra TaxID=262757 RepID=A0A6A1V2B1_9ROSI|nr:Ninja-family protein AFP2 [Morella rubra]